MGDYGAEDLTEFDGIVVGCPTWTLELTNTARAELIASAGAKRFMLGMAAAGGIAAALSRRKARSACELWE